MLNNVKVLIKCACMYIYMCPYIVSVVMEGIMYKNDGNEYMNRLHKTKC